MLRLKLLLILTLLVTLSSGTAYAIEYGGIGGRPAYPRKEEPKSDNVFIHTVKEGQTINEGIKVINNTQTIKTLMIYPADYIPSTDGGFACRQLAEKQTEVGTWINLEKTEVTLKPLTNEVIDFTINVPTGLDAGEHNGCVLVQEKKPEVKKAGMNLSIRTGLRVLLTVPGELLRQLELVSFKVVPNSLGHYFLIPELKNTGNVSIDANVKVITTNLFGMRYFQHGGIYSILKKDTARWNFELKHPFWGGIYKAKVTVDYNNGSKQIFLEKPAITFFVLPTIQAMIIIFAAILPFILMLIFFLMRKQEAKHVRATWRLTTIVHGDTLTSLAKKHGVSWKKLARVNNIKAPYSLTSGEQILVPVKKANKNDKNS